MARIRTIKPDFFKHGDLFDAESETGLPMRIAFAGLWTCCDREGRFKWRPRELKTDILPHDELDFSRVLDALATRGFIEQYASETGELFGFVPSFLEHQVINNRESQSLIPCPFDACCTRDPRGLSKNKGKGREGKGKEGKEIVGKTADCPYSDIVSKYHEYLPMLAGVKVLTDARKRIIKARWFEDEKRQNIDWWSRYFKFVSTIPFLIGENDRGWQADIDFLFTQKNFVKIIEGGYERRSND